VTANDPVATVRRMFDAFAQRDLDRLVETVHPESRWTYVGANPRPGKGTFVGPDGVRKFFGNILKNLEIAEFHLGDFVVEGDIVVVFGFESGTVKASGSPFRNEWAQKYVVRDGLITEMEEYNIQVTPRP
jgi:uncharacterized protein